MQVKDHNVQHAALKGARPDVAKATLLHKRFVQLRQQHITFVFNCWMIKQGIRREWILRIVGALEKGQ